ncbi:MAG: histidinol-phosphatase [Pseudomonadota bacterium]
MDAFTPATAPAFERLAHEMADAARRAVLPYFRGGELSIENKSSDGFDPVTAGDRAAETAIREIIAAQRPDDGVLGEEFPPIESKNGLTWVLDPIDGTRAFMSGIPLWGVLIALFDGDRPRLGLIDQPHIGERFVGVPDATAPLAILYDRFGARPLKTRACSRLETATLLTTSPALFNAGSERAAYDKVEASVRLARYGADCYGYAMVAAGQADLVVEAGLAAYDVQAPIALVEAAGGVATDWRGGPAHHGGRIVAAGDHELHAQALALLSDA